MINFIHIARAATEAAQEASAESSGGIGSLGINLKLFIAQLINFGIILIVLWKWVFTPVAKKLTERTERVEKAMRDAASTEKEKQEFFTWKDTEMVKVRSQAQAIVTAAESQAQKSKSEILEQAKAEQAKVIEQARSQIEQEKQKALQEAKSELADIVTTATEKILREKIDEKKDKNLIAQFLETIK